MTPEQFCYWLQGRAELRPDEPLSVDEWKAVRDHLKLVFKKETPGARINPFLPHPQDASGQHPLQASALQQSFGRMVVDDTSYC